MKKEIWKTVIIDGVENPRYKVSSFGQIICLNWHNYGKPRLCSLTKHRDGYLQVRIDGVWKLVHRIVADTFIPNPQNKPFIDHIDTNRKNNRVENLRWCTHRENCNNSLSRKHNSENNWCRGKFGAEHHRSIQIVQLTLDGKFIKKWSATMEVERELGIQHTNITACCRGKKKYAGGFRWIYASEYFKRKKSLKEIRPLF